MLAIDNLADTLGNKGADPRERLLEERIRSMNYAYEVRLLMHQRVIHVEPPANQLHFFRRV